MISIKTKKGWKPLWRLSPPERPVYPDPTKHGDWVERWRDEQLALLMELRAQAEKR